MYFVGKAQQKWITIATLSAVVIFAALLRLHNIEHRTLDHPEVYAPGIDLPWHLSNPNPRFTLWQTLAGTIAGEPHPPGYYVVMLGWTKWFGSSIFSLRLPSLLFGIASILLIYVLATHTEDTLTALLATAMLAANGLHLYWSQNARMYSMACFLGLLSTVLLVLITKNAPRQRTYGVLYLIVTLTGLATHVYFWTVFATQVFWVLATSLHSRRSLPGLLRLQIFTVIIATPLVAIAVYQSSAATRPTTLPPLQGVLRFLQLGSLLETDPLAVSTASVNTVAAILALLATALLIATAVLRKREDHARDHQLSGEVKTYGSPPLGVTVAVGVLMASIILVFAYVAKTMLPGRSTQLVVITSILPIALVFVDFLFCKYWERLQGLRIILSKTSPWPGSFRSLNFLLAVLPVSIVAVLSFVNPLFVQRGTLVFIPYLLIVLASGLATLVRRDRRYVAIALILAITHGLSLLHFMSKPSNYDYKGLAEQWVSQIEDSDLIFVHGRGHERDWLVAPIYYYLNARRYNFVGRDFASEIQNHPRSRVWVLSFPHIPTEKEAIKALATYQVRERIDARKIFAQLYVGQASGHRPIGDQ